MLQETIDHSKVMRSCNFTYQILGKIQDHSAIQKEFPTKGTYLKENLNNHNPAEKEKCMWQFLHVQGTYCSDQYPLLDRCTTSILVLRHRYKYRFEHEHLGRRNSHRTGTAGQCCWNTGQPRSLQAYLRVSWSVIAITIMYVYLDTDIVCLGSCAFTIYKS